MFKVELKTMSHKQLLQNYLRISQKLVVLDKLFFRNTWNWSNRLEIWGTLTLLIHACWKSQSRVDVSKDQRVNQVRLANYANELSGK